MKKLNTFYGFKCAVCLCVFAAMIVYISGCAGAAETTSEVRDRNKKIIKLEQCRRFEHNYYTGTEIMADSWEEFEWDNPPDQIRHEAPEDIRKRIYLTSVGKYASSVKTTKTARTIGTTDKDAIYFAAAWEDVMHIFRQKLNIFFCVYLPVPHALFDQEDYPTQILPNCQP